MDSLIQIQINAFKGHNIYLMFCHEVALLPSSTNHKKNLTLKILNKLSYC